MCGLTIEVARCVYLVIAILISFSFGLHYGKTEKVNGKFGWNAFAWNFCLYLLGFCIFYAEYDLFKKILSADNAGMLGIYVLLALMLLLWGSFCLSGRGSALIQAGIDRGIVITISLSGIKIELPKPELSK